MTPYRGSKSCLLISPSASWCEQPGLERVPREFENQRANDEQEKFAHESTAVA